MIICESLILKEIKENREREAVFGFFSLFVISVLKKKISKKEMPPPPPPPPPQTTSYNGSNRGTPVKSNERARLLSEIQTGTKLRKTITNDRSAPVIGNSGICIIISFQYFPSFIILALFQKSYFPIES